MSHSTQFMRTVRLAGFAGVFAIVAALAGCGGGGSNGDGNSAGADPGGTTSGTLPATASAAGTLVISEVGTNYYRDDIAWLEVHNATAAPISLAGYSVRSASMVPSTGDSGLAPVNFALPDITVPAQGDLVIAAKVYDSLADTSQIVYVKNGTMVPYWNGNGSVELVNGGQTVDFVRFGNATAAPLSEGAWSGNNVAALPSGADQHGKSIVRLASGGLADTNTAADWTLVNFATPGGPNDVAAGVVDSDHDGIPDSAKRAGGSYAGLDLWTMGARPGRRDIFLEVDHMNGDDPALTPRREALQKVVDAFAVKNIALHIDAGNLYSDALDPAAFNLGGGNAVDFASCIELDTGGMALTPGCASFYAYKGTNFDLRRRLMFHYALFSNSQNADGSAGSSGVAELPGNDLIVSLGGYGFSTGTTSGMNMLINLQAGTLMHELGHNFGLRHGGNEEVNYKPNHYSVMNYLYQFAGLSATPDSVNAAERYYLANGLKGKTYCNLVENSPCGSAFIISYSDGSGAALDENRLSEVANIGHGSTSGAYADWNNSNSLTNGIIARNINPLDGTGRTVLTDYDEWDNLKITFSRSYAGSNSGSNAGEALAFATAPERQADPMNERARSKMTEALPPAELLTALRNLAPPHCDTNDHGQGMRTHR
jgi:hypothetical protein